MKRSHRYKLLGIALCGLFAIKVIAAIILNLGIDEAYYWYYSLHLKPAYFDHPPAVAYTIYVTTIGQLLKSEIFVRGGALLAFVITGLLMWIYLYRKNGLSAAILFLALYSLSIYTQFIAGMMILPDAPLLLFSGLLFYGVLCLNDTPNNRVYWLITGLALALSIWCKYQSFWWLISLPCWLLINNEKFNFQARTLPLILTITASTGLLVYYNFSISSEQMTLHTSRFQWEGIKPLNLLTAILGEVVYMHPVVFILVLVGITHWKASKGIDTFLLLSSLPIIMAGWGLSLIDKTLPHWTGPAYLPLFIYTARTLSLSKYIRLITMTAIITLLLAVCALIEVQNGYVLNQLDVKLTTEERGKKDGTLDVYGWDQLANILPDDGVPLVINHWFPGAQMHYYVANDQVSIIPYGNFKSLHEYVWNSKFGDKPPTAYFIESSRYPRRFSTKLDQEYMFDYMEDIPVLRRKDTVLTYTLFKLTTCPGLESQ